MKATGLFQVKRSFRVLTCAVALLVISSAFTRQAIAITGGDVDHNNTYSNVGCVVFVPPDGLAPPFVYFSGTLIHPRVLLTAGHTGVIMQELPGVIPYLRVSFGTDALDPSTWHEVETGFAHPDYHAANRQVMDNNPRSNDVGVIILKEPIDDLPLAKLPKEGFLDELKAAHLLREPGQGGTRVIVAGYGTTLDWPPPEQIPPDGWRRFAETEYRALTQSWLHTSQNLNQGNGGGGLGDSGGPNFWVQPDGTLVLVAVTSRGDPNCVSNNISWRVDIPETLDFIDWVIDTVLPTLP